MMTVEDFQQQVLLPLRRERDEKLAALQDEFEAIDYAYRQRCDDIHERRLQFNIEQHRREAEMKEQLRADALEADRYRRTGYDGIKARRVRINESYQDALGRAFARYNAERAQHGEPPVTRAAAKPDNEDEQQVNGQASEQANEQANEQKGGAR